MMITDFTRNRMMNKSLEKYGVTMEQILAYNNEGLIKTGKMKGKKDEHVPYYEYYHFDNEEEYQEWKKFCLSVLVDIEVTKPMDVFVMFDMIWGLSQPYLFLSQCEENVAIVSEPVTILSQSLDDEYKKGADY